MVALNLLCLVDGESTSRAFPVSVPSTETIGSLKKLIKTEKSPRFDDIAANELTLWRVSISLGLLNERKPIVLSEVESAVELDPTDDISDNFEEKPPKKTIHIIVQRPPPRGNVNALFFQ